MSARSFALLVDTAYAPQSPEVFEESVSDIYTRLEQELKASRARQNKPSEELGFRFERLRLGIAIAFVKAYSRLADNEGAAEVLQLLQEAINAKSTREIDKIIQKKIKVFDNLYHEIFVHEQREHILGLFERTLDATSKEELDELILEGLEVLQEIDLENVAHDEDEDEPLDEDFLKSIQ